MVNTNFHVEDHTAEVIAAKDRAVDKFLVAAGLHLEGQAKKELEVSPRRVDTGLLRNSITHALDGEATAISTYKADKPREGSREAETGSYSGATPEEPKGQRALYIGTNVEYGVYVIQPSTTGPRAWSRTAF